MPQLVSPQSDVKKYRCGVQSLREPDSARLSQTDRQKQCLRGHHPGSDLQISRTGWGCPERQERAYLCRHIIIYLEVFYLWIIVSRPVSSSETAIRKDIKQNIIIKLLQISKGVTKHLLHRAECAFLCQHPIHF